MQVRRLGIVKGDWVCLLLGTGLCCSETLYGPSKMTAFMVVGSSIVARKQHCQSESQSQSQPASDPGLVYNWT
jgi:hypothetical protein